MTELFELAGGYTLHPGASASITGQRPVLGAGLLSRVLRGRDAEQVERTLGQLFSVCSHAHRRAARLAMHAAQRTVPGMLPEPPSQELHLRTALDHLRSMATDWPSQGVGWSTPCPMSLVLGQLDIMEAQATAALSQLRRWLEDSVLNQPVVDWLAQHRQPEDLLIWCQHNSATVPPALFLVNCHVTASVLQTDFCPLDLLDCDAQQQASRLRQMAQAIANDAAFAQRPNWQGQCAETGAWTRLRHRHATTGKGIDGRGSMNAWTRLASRWYELIELCSDAQGLKSQAAALSSGALALGHGQALGWCEMARGLLLHWVQLDGNGLVDAYQVVAPTEWNFHPYGALAKALMQLAPHDSAGAILLGKAFDACVDCQVSPVAAVEGFHA